MRLDYRIIPISAHAAFDKASLYFGIKLHKIPVDVETRKVDIRKVKRAINPNTIMLVGSAVRFLLLLATCVDRTDVKLLSLTFLMEPSTVS